MREKLGDTGHSLLKSTLSKSVFSRTLLLTQADE